MPANYAHYRFGTELLPSMPQTVLALIQAHEKLFLTGLLGPDFLNFTTRKSVATLANRYHMQTGAAFFTRACQMVRTASGTAAQSYLYGLLCHFCLDSVVHPTVNGCCRTLADHMHLEGEFERFLLAQDGKSITWPRNISKFLRLSHADCRTVALFYPELTVQDVSRCLNNMALINRIATVSPGIPRKLAALLLSQVSQAARDTMIPTQPAPSWVQFHDPLLQQYYRAHEIFPDMLQSLHGHLLHGTSLSRDFEPIFG